MLLPFADLEFPLWRSTKVWSQAHWRTNVVKYMFMTLRNVCVVKKVHDSSLQLNLCSGESLVFHQKWN